MDSTLSALLTGLLIPGMFLVLKHFLAANKKALDTQIAATNSFKNYMDQAQDLIRLDIDRLYKKIGTCEGQIHEFQRTARDLYTRIDDCNQKCNRIVHLLEKLTKLDVEHVGEDAFRFKEKKKP